MGGSSGGGGNTTSTVTQTNLPEYARPYFEDLLGKTQAVSAQPYTPYGGQRVADLNDYQTHAMNGIASLQQPWMTARAQDVNNQATYGLAGSGLDKYESGPIGSTYQQKDIQMFGRPDQVQATFKPGEFDSATAQKYMNPYQQNVIDIAKREAIRQSGMQGQGDQSKAVGAGAFGGSRAALVDAERERNLGQQLDDIQMKGSADAYNNAESQFERDRNAQLAGSNQNLDASKFNVNTGMDYGKTGLGVQQYNEGQRYNAADLAMRGQVANEQARQGAAGIRSGFYTNLGALGQQAASQGAQQQQMALDRYNAALGVGNQIQNHNQQNLDVNYTNFVNQRDWDRNNLNFYSGILRGTPVQANSDTQTFTPAPSFASQLGGAGVAALGAYGAYQRANGG